MTLADWGLISINQDGIRHPGGLTASGTRGGAMSKHRRCTPALILAVLVAATSACGERDAPAPVDVPLRIVAMAPSLTETLIALDLEDRVVGVTRYCPKVDGAVSVGGYFDPSYETILSLDPDLVIVMQSHDELHRRLGDLGLDTLRVDQHDVQGILTSVETIAARCGVEQRGRDLVENLRRALDEVAIAVKGFDRPRVLVVVGRNPGGGKIGTLWAAAADTFYDDVIDLAGGVNAVSNTVIRYPELSREGIIAVDPDVILDVVADGGARAVSPDTAAADWLELEDLRAVQNHRVHVLMQDFVVIPGPRIVHTVRAFAEHLHPELQWQ
jgi:cobalamin transport system substrate-binding protein